MSDRGNGTALLCIVGASGAGKTAAVEALAARSLPGVACFSFDSIGVPSGEVMERDFGGGEGWQRAMTEQWIARLTATTNAFQVAVLEGQTRPSFIRPALARTGIDRARIVLLDAHPDVRAARLRGPRGQPELATPAMDAWAAYLRGQADALDLPVIDTTERTIHEVADAIVREIGAVRDGESAAG